MKLEPGQVAWLMKLRIDDEARALCGLVYQPGTGGARGQHLRRARALLTEAGAALAAASAAPWQ